MMKKMMFEIETITPMFLAGADQSKAELRAASIKGLLRFWWRALQADSDLTALRNRESQIFGSTDEKAGGGSSFSIRVTRAGDLKTIRTKFPDNSQYKIPVEGKTFKMHILEYLAYGLYDSKNRSFQRDYIPGGQRFGVDLTIRKDAYLQDILRSMFVFCLFGGIGSRTRNGFGSFDISNKIELFEAIRSDDFAIDAPYHSNNLTKLVKVEKSMSYPSFSRRAKVFSAKERFITALDSLADVGKIYKSGRSALEKRHQFQKRQFIGAPLYPPRESFKSFLDRHAKPYFIKIAKEGNGYRAYILYLPSLYCEGLEKESNNKPIIHDEVNMQFDAVCTEFNSFLADHMEEVL
jgi:CRISPR-associated protein Cmr1